MTPRPSLRTMPDIGTSTGFAVSVTEADVTAFADLSGDYAKMHVDDGFMAQTTFGRRIAHGALLVAYMSRASTMISNAAETVNPHGFPVSLGFDRMRFLAPVFLGDKILVEYRISEIDRERGRTLGEISITNQDEVLVAIAVHVMKWVIDPPAPTLGAALTGGDPL